MFTKRTLILSVLLMILGGILHAASITIVSPNGGETWCRGSNVEIIWTSEGVTNPLKITLWWNNVRIGLIKTNIPPTTNRIRWEAGRYVDDRERNRYAPFGDGFKIRIKEVGTTVMDESDGPFSFPQATFNNLIPAGMGGGFHPTGTYRVSWESTCIQGTVQVVLLQDNRAVGTIYRGGDTGSFPWEVGNFLDGRPIEPGTYQMRIMAVANNDVRADAGFDVIVFQERPEQTKPDLYIRSLGVKNNKPEFEVTNLSRIRINRSVRFAVWKHVDNPVGTAPDFQFSHHLDLGQHNSIKLNPDFSLGDEPNCGIVVHVMADYSNQIPEQNENNNYKGKRLYTRNNWAQILYIKLGKPGNHRRLTASTPTITITPQMALRTFNRNYGKQIDVPISVILKNCGYDSRYFYPKMVIGQIGFMKWVQEPSFSEQLKPRAKYIDGYLRLARFYSSEIVFRGPGATHQIDKTIGLRLVPSNKRCQLKITFGMDTNPDPSYWATLFFRFRTFARKHSIVFDVKFEGF